MAHYSIICTNTGIHKLLTINVLHVVTEGNTILRTRTNRRIKRYEIIQNWGGGHNKSLRKNKQTKKPEMYNDDQKEEELRKVEKNSGYMLKNI